MNRVVIVSLIMLFMTGVSLFSQTPKEIYDYEYIVALYEQQADSTALTEIESFSFAYPNSAYLPSVMFMEAEIYYFSGNFAKANITYNKLLPRINDISALSDVYLHDAVSLYYLSQYDYARERLEYLQKLTDDEEYTSQASLWLAKTTFAAGQYFSSEKYYRQAIELFPDDKAIRFEHFTCLLRLSREDEASAIFDSLPTDETYRNQYLEALLAYYLGNSQYSSFRELVRKNNITFPNDDQNLQLLIIQYYYMMEDYTVTDALLLQIPYSTPKLDFYRALINKQKGHIAQADSLFAILTRGDDPELAVLSYLERLRILFLASPSDAMQQLQSFMDSPHAARYKGVGLLLSGIFAYQAGDYIKSISYLNSSQAFQLDGEQLERAASLIPKNWYKLNEFDRATAGYNRYLNLYPEGRYRDQAWFDLGMIDYNRKDYLIARFYFQNLLNEKPSESYLSDAGLYLGEICFFRGEYNEAIPYYLHSSTGTTTNPFLLLRTAQSYYFLKDYTNADKYLQQVTDPAFESDKLLLKGSILFDQYQYRAALDTYNQAIEITSNPMQLTELLSYKALTLYQLKQFKEASTLFLELSSLKESPDTYLYLSAKSAYQGGNYPQALQLYDRFIDNYPDSDYILDVSSEIATINYNQGNFSESLDNWISILRRYKTKQGFEPAELQLLQNVFSGIELCLIQSQDLVDAEMIMDMVDSFTSDYIKFELQYILVKLYASRDQWEDLISEADSIRSAMPSMYTSDIELLVVESLIRLNRYTEADSLLTISYAVDQNPKTLLKWAELDELNRDYSDALDKYQKLYARTPDPQLWLKMLQCSAQLDFSGFRELWNINNQTQYELPDADLIYLQYLLRITDYESARRFAEAMLLKNFNPAIHSQCYLVLAKIQYDLAQYTDCISSLQRIKLVFRDYPDVIREANYFLIKSMYQSGLKYEAQSLYNDLLPELTADMINDLTEMMSE